MNTDKIIAEWLRDGCQKSIEGITAIIQDCVYGKGSANRCLL